MGRKDSGIKPLVRTGDNVKAGQIIWQDDASVSSPVHSPVDGVVESVITIDSAQGPMSAVKIATSPSDNYEKVPAATAEWKKLTNIELEKVIYLSGAGSLGSDGIPTSFKSSVINPVDVEHIVVQGADSELRR